MAHSVEVEPVGGLGVERGGAVDGERADGGVPGELGGAQQKGQELKVVEAPHAVRAGGLEVVGGLRGAREAQVRGQQREGDGGQRGAGQRAAAVQREGVHEKVQLVAGAVVEALGGSECGTQVRAQLLAGAGGQGGQVVRVQRRQTGRQARVKGAEGGVAEARAVVVAGRGVVEEVVCGSEDGEHAGDGGVRWLGGAGGDGHASDGVGDGEYEADQQRVRRARKKEPEIRGHEDTSCGMCKGDGREG